MNAIPALLRATGEKSADLLVVSPVSSRLAVKLTADDGRYDATTPHTEAEVGKNFKQRQEYEA